MNEIQPEIDHIYEVEITEMSGHVTPATLKFEGQVWRCGHEGCKIHESLPNFSFVSPWTSGAVGLVQNILILREVTNYRPELFN